MPDDPENDKLSNLPPALTSPTKVVTVRMTPTFYNQMREAAHRKKISMNSYIIGAIDERISTEEPLTP